MKKIFTVFVIFFAFCLLSQSQEIKYAFSGKTSEENKVALQGAGFGTYPQANVTFGYVPIDNGFDGATDGQGVIITAKPGEGVMVFGEKVATNKSAMIRCSVRTDQAHAAIIIATIGDKPDQFVSTNTPNNEAYFTGQYQRISVFCTPPSTGFQPVIQIVNTSKTESLTAYLDNFEVYPLDTSKYYSAAFLDGDLVDPPVNQISISNESNMNFGDSGLLRVVSLSDTVSIGFRYCPSGTMKRGSESIPVNTPFYIGISEVTQKQWQAVMGSNPSSIKGDALPVGNVSYSDCQDFITKLNTKGQGTFRLPTILEWEYACRAGTSTRFYWGEDTMTQSPDGNLLVPDAKNIGKYAWYYSNADKQPHPVAKKTPNSWSLYDMSGNVEEWSSTSDSSGHYCLCGGSYWDYPLNCTSTPNGWVLPTTKLNQLGLRLVMAVN